MTPLSINMWTYVALLARCGVRRIHVYPMNLSNTP